MNIHEQTVYRNLNVLYYRDFLDAEAVANGDQVFEWEKWTFQIAKVCMSQSQCNCRLVVYLLHVSVHVL